MMVNFSASGIAFVFMWFFAWLFVSSYFMARPSGHTLKGRMSRILFIVLAFLGASVVYYLSSQANFPAILDNGGFYHSAYTFMLLLFSRPFLALCKLGGTVLFAEYNAILPMITALPLKIAGYSFTRYILVNYVLFIVPAFFVLASIIKRQTEGKYLALALFMMFMFCPFYYPLLRAYNDVACLVPASLALWLMADYDAPSFDREQVKRDVYISALLLCTLMFRRYFAFYVIGYMSALGLLSLYLVAFDKSGRSKFRGLINAILNIAVIGAFALFVMGVFFSPMLYRTLRMGYSDMYVAYDETLKAKLFEFVSKFGYITLTLAGLGVILPLFTRRMRKYSLFCAISLAVTGLAFFQVQAMGLHHYYTITLQVFLLAVIGAVSLVHVFRKSGVMKGLVGLVVAAAFVIGGANCVMPEVRGAIGPAGVLFSETYDTPVRSDLPALREVNDYLYSLAGDNRMVYFLASGPAFGSGLLASLGEPYYNAVKYKVGVGKGVDLRDGFPVDILNADILVTTDPVQLHLPEGTQEIVRFPAVELMKGSASPFGRHYKRDDRVFTVEGDVKVYIFEKQSEPDEEALQYLADYFTNKYPGHEDIFAGYIFNRTTDWERYSNTNRGLAVKIMNYLLEKGYFTPEELALITDKSIDEINKLTMK